MTNKEINIAIGEHCGYKNVVVRSDGTLTGYNPDHRNTLIPNYVNDLNAIQDAEKMSLSGSTAWLEFAVNLMRVLEAEQMSEVNGMTCILQATARQRAEAFLRTIGKWKE